MNVRGIKFFLLLLLSAFPLLSPAQFYHFSQYSLEEGLPQSEVTAIVEDELGYMWVGTNGGGICRFNGKSFDVYTTKNGLQDNIIFGLFLDDNFDLWIASPKGIMRYDGKSFHKIINSDSTLFIDEVRFFETSGDNIWVHSNLSNGKRGFFRIKNDSVVNAYDLFDELNAENSILYVTAFNNNHLVITTADGYYDLVSDSLSESTILPADKDYLYIPLQSDRNNNIWAVAMGKIRPERKLVLFTPDGRSKDVRLPDGIDSKRIFKSYQDREGGIWFSVFNNGVVRYINGKWDVLDENNGLPLNNIRVIHEDAEGNFWLGTLGAGLARYSGDMFISFDTRSGLSDNIIRSVYQDSKGIYYFGGNSSGLNVFDGKSIKVVYRDKADDNGFISSIYEDRPGNLLLGTLNGLCCYDGKQIADCSKKYGFEYPYPIMDIASYGDTLLFATYGRGLVKSFNGKVVEYNKKTSDLNTILVTNILVDSKKRVWLSTDNGIWLYNDSITDINKKYGLDATYLTQAAEDKAGNIWFAVYTGGLLKFDGTKFSSVDVSKGLTSDNIYSVITDSEGNIWAGTQNGVDKLTLNNAGDIISIENFGKYDGFVGIENNGAANFLDKEGNLWFGTIKGVIKYNPRKRRINYLPPPVYVTKMEVGFKTIPWTGAPYNTMYDSIIPWINMPAGLKLPHNMNHISFSFNGLCYSVPEKVKYRWKLEPVEKDYLPETKQNRAVYASLPPGSYTFYVKACNNSGIWNEEPAVFSFTVEPAWWQTMALKIFVVLFIISLVTLIIRAWRRRDRQFKNEMRSLIESKSKEIQKKNNILKERDNEVVKLKSGIDELRRLIEKYDESISELSLFGKKAVSGADTENLFMESYADLSKVMKVRLYGLGLLNEKQKTLEFRYVINNGERSPFITFPLDDVDRLSIHSLLNKKEIVIDDFDVEYKKYVKELRPVPGDINSRSIIFMPLIIDKRTIGVLTVQTPEEGAYSDRHVAFVRIVAGFLSIAVDPGPGK
jgi:ligand-binding sensor domain-containing protein